MQIIQSRRDFLASLSAAGAAGLVGVGRPLADEASLETTTIRLVRTSGICVAPIYIAEELLRAEGFADIRYVSAPGGVAAAEVTTRGEADFLLTFAAPLLIPMDAGEPLTVIAGAHVGCFELFANDTVHRIADLKGKSVGVQAIGSSQHVFLASMATYVGLDPNRDINWVTSSSPKPKELFAEGKIDAFLGFPPEPQEMRARNIGHVIVNSALDQSMVAVLLLHGGGQHATSSASIRSRPSGCCGRSSRPPTSAPPTRKAPHDVWSMADSPSGMTTRFRRSRTSPTTAGASTTPRTRCGSMRCGCTRRA